MDNIILEEKWTYNERMYTHHFFKQISTCFLNIEFSSVLEKYFCRCVRLRHIKTLIMLSHSVC